MIWPLAAEEVRKAPAVQSGSYAQPRLCSALSYAIVCGGMATIAVAVYTMVVSYSSLPWWDTWEYLSAIAHGTNPLSPDWLWRQHNEHRLVLQKLFFAIDLEVFRGRQIFLLSSIIVIQLLHVALWAWILRVLGGWRGALWLTGAGMMAFVIFCPAPWLNYTMGFQVCYVLSPLFATLSFAALLRYWRDGQSASKWLWLAIAAALGANYSLSNGNLVWLLLVTGALVLRLRRSAVLAIAVTGALSISLYFYHYVRPPQHADPIASLHEPLRLLTFWAAYFGSSWVGASVAIAAAIGAVGLTAAIVVVCRTRYYVRELRPIALLLAMACLFFMGTAINTAAGRLNFGLAMAFQNRYQTFALLFWGCLGLMVLDYIFATGTRPYPLFVAQVFLLAIFLRGGLLAERPIREARAHGFGLNVASAAFQSGIYEPSLLAQVSEHSDKLLSGLEYLREHRLSLFSGEESSLLGSPLEKSFKVAAAGSCAGRLEFSIPRDFVAPGLYVAGWAWDRKHQRAPQEIVATIDDVITGVAVMGHRSGSAETADAEVTSHYAGFAGYARQPQPTAVLKVYAILQGSPPTACYLDGTDSGHATSELDRELVVK